MNAIAFRRACLIAVYFFTAGCNTMPPAPPIPPETTINWVEHVRHLTELKDWHIQGKIGVKTVSDGGSAYLDWLQTNDSFHITLSGPLGQGTTTISGNESGARLESASQGAHISESPEQLLYDHTGWYIPLGNLLYWIKGLPEPKTPYSETRTPQGLISTLNQGPWSLSFSQYATHLGHPLPSKIKIQSQDLKVTLAIKSWAPLLRDLSETDESNLP